MQTPTKLKFTLRVEVPFDKESEIDSLEKDGAPFYFNLNLNPDIELEDVSLFEEKDDLMIKRVPKILDAIRAYIVYLEGLSKAKGKSTHRIGGVVYRRNSPVRSNISYVASVNGDIRPKL